MKSREVKKAGWLRAELEAATKDVEAWPIGMRQHAVRVAGKNVEQIQKSNDASDVQRKVKSSRS